MNKFDFRFSYRASCPIQLRYYRGAILGQCPHLCFKNTPLNSWNLIQTISFRPVCFSFWSRISPLAPIKWSYFRVIETRKQTHKEKLWFTHQFYFKTKLFVKTKLKHKIHLLIPLNITYTKNSRLLVN